MVFPCFGVVTCKDTRTPFNLHNFQYTAKKGLLAERVIDSLASPDELEAQISINDLLGLFDLSQNERGQIEEKPTSQHQEFSFPTNENLTLSLPQLQQKLFSLSPGDFERLVARVIERLGYPNVEHTGQTSDGGVDVMAWRNVAPAGVEYLFVQCKRYKANVGVQEARKLLGVISAQGNQYSGLLVTSSDFTSACRKFVAQSQGKVRLMNGIELARHIQTLGIDL